jgi:hypothetical protein
MDLVELKAVVDRLSADSCRVVSQTYPAIVWFRETTRRDERWER